MPTPDVFCQPFHYCWRSASLEFVYKIPVELEQVQRTFQPTLVFREALCFSHQSATPFTAYTVEVLDVRCLYFV